MEMSRLRKQTTVRSDANIASLRLRSSSRRTETMPRSRHGASPEGRPRHRIAASLCVSHLRREGLPQRLSSVPNREQGKDCLELARLTDILPDAPSGGYDCRALREPHHYRMPACPDHLADSRFAHLRHLRAAWAQGPSPAVRYWPIGPPNSIVLRYLGDAIWRFVFGRGLALPVAQAWPIVGRHTDRRGRKRRRSAWRPGGQPGPAMEVPDG